MKRPLLLAALFFASLALAPPASAQYGFSMWGSRRGDDLDIQKQRAAIKAQRQKYSAPVRARTAHKPPALELGTPGPYGRVDLSGRPAPGYAAIRDNSAIFGPPRHISPRSAPNVYSPRTSTHPHRATPPAPRFPSPRRIPPPPPIPSW